VIIPLRPTPMDYLAAATMGSNISKAALLKPGIKVFLLINSKPTGRDQLGREAHDAALEIFQNIAVPVGLFETEVCNRTAFAKAPATGMTVLDYEPESKAAEEIVALTREVIQKCLTATDPLEASSRA
jgi:cellulose biosynthesis protein BcsQ